MRMKGILLGLLMASTQVLAVEPAIPFEVIKQDQLGSIKLSLDVQVPLVDGRLPTADELGAVSEHLVATSGKHDRTFVAFYLPGMEVGAGAFATAHHDPEMEVRILDFMLMQYPQYLELLE
ncbi:hypothetical protein [Nitrincola iocasae]|uniref:Uncharacterized protein n=1 Tax=Nitrincola iocasae TaxID=2614693 RepID=A0A5J6LCL3_9GAMM|nr:hypothetical protein [Nitrincola iocasae]QEW06339.1 hypothetical protein F5I99_07380 [Nitrincola iocasae]